MEEDLEKVQFEREKISELAATMKETRDQVLARLRELFRENIRLAKSLEAFHNAALQRADQEVESAASAR